MQLVLYRAHVASAPLQPQGMPRRIVGAKIACLDMNLQKTRMQVRRRAMRSCRACSLA